MAGVTLLYLYRESGDGGRELRYALRSLKHLQDEHEVVLMGDSESWLQNVKHIPTRYRTHSPYADVFMKLLNAANDPEMPESFWVMQDDIYFTEPQSLRTLYEGDLPEEGRGIHKRGLQITRELLIKEGKSYKNYDIHVPFKVEKKKLLEIAPTIQRTLQGVPMAWRSYYGNTFNVGGEQYIDKKTRTKELLQGDIISTLYFTEELQALLPDPSKYEGETKPRIMFKTHFSTAKARTGMTLMVQDIVNKLRENYRVDVAYLRENIVPKGEFDLIMGHYPYNDGADIQLFDTVDVKDAWLPKYTKPKLAIFTTSAIQKHLDYPGILLHPPVYPENHQTERGDKITFIGLSVPKGLDVLIDLAKNNPDKQFLGVRSGWQKEKQYDPQLPNVEVMEEVRDMKAIWAKTRILISPSYEQYGKANLEAMASGIPVIAFDCDGTREALGDAAYFVPSKDPSDYQKALEHVEKHYTEYSEKSLKQSKAVDSKRELEELLQCVKDLL